MNSIIEHLMTEETGHRYPWRTPLSFIPMDADIKTVCRAIRDDNMEEHEMKLTVKTVFKCRNIDYRFALRNAEKMLLQSVYRGMLNNIALLRAAVYECDVEGAMNILGEMEREMGMQ